MYFFFKKYIAKIESGFVETNMNAKMGSENL